MSAKRWFSYDPGGIPEFDFHDTEDEARKAAEDAFDQERDACDGDWSENVEEICWGEIRQRVVEVSRKPAPAGMRYQELVEYELRDVEGEPINPSRVEELPQLKPHIVLDPLGDDDEEEELEPIDPGIINDARGFLEEMQEHLRDGTLPDEYALREWESMFGHLVRAAAGEETKS